MCVIISRWCCATIMHNYPPSKIALFIVSMVGMVLLIARWFYGGELAGFFLIMIFFTLFWLRWRVAGLGATSVVDVVACVLLWPLGLALALFWAMFYRIYVAVLAVGVFFFVGDWWDVVTPLLGALAGLFLGLWNKEHETRWQIRDSQAERYYKLEAMQRELLAATAQVERMTAVSERARISREIHDNAGHEIVAAYMSLQTARGLFDGSDADALALYDAALERLELGAQKIREAVHNLAPLTALGVEALQETCRRYDSLPVECTLFGDTSHVPVYIWNALESCLNEALTNAGRHARPTCVAVRIDATPHLVRLSVENDGMADGSGEKKAPRAASMGAGLRNLRYRMAAIGGSLAIDAGEVFRLICVVPIIKEEQHAPINMR